MQGYSAIQVHLLEDALGQAINNETLEVLHIEPEFHSLGPVVLIVYYSYEPKQGGEIRDRRAVKCYMHESKLEDLWIGEW